MAKLRIKKGDTVLVLVRQGQGPAPARSSQSYPETDRVLVEGVNRIKKHTKVGQTQRGAKTGGIITQEAPIHVSNVQLVDRGRRQEGRDARPESASTNDGNRVRVSRRTGEDI